MQFVLAVRRILSVIFIWTLSISYSSGQITNLDSLRLVLKNSKEDTLKVKTLCHLSYGLFGSDPDSTILLGRQAFELSVKLDFVSWQSKALNRIGIGFYMKSQYDSAYHYYLQSKEKALVVNDLETVANIDTNLGIIHWYKGEYEDAARLMNETRKYYESVGNLEQQGKTLANIGSIYLGIDDYPEAIEYFKKAIKIQKEGNNPRASAVSYNNLALCYANIGKYDKSLESYYMAVEQVEGSGDNILASSYGGIANILNKRGEYQQSLEFRNLEIEILEDNDAKYDLISTLNGLGNTFKRMKNYEESMNSFLKALKILNSFEKICGWEVLVNISSLKGELDQYDSVIYYAQLGIDKAEICSNSRLIAQSKANIAEAYLYMDQVSNAKPYAIEAYKLAKHIKTREIQKEASELLSQIYESQKKYDKSLAYFKESAQLKDSLLDVEKAAEIARMQSEYEFNKEKEALQTEADKAAIEFEADQKRSNIMLYFSVAVVILFIGLFISAYISYRRKRSANELITLQNHELEELSGFKEGLTNMIAHDMKNSLNTILGLSGSEPYDKKMQTISQSGNVMLNLVTNMLDVQKFEEAQMQVSLRNQKLWDIIEDARLQVAVLFQMKSLSLELNVHRNVEVNVDSEILTRVFVNLLTNAIKYSQTGRKVIIRSELNKDQDSNAFAHIYFKDEGIGIAEDDLPHVFDKFWQTKAMKSGAAMSTGLGLTFCKLAIEAHHGEITVESTLGEGSEFCISLPVDANKVWLDDHSDTTLYDSSVLNITLEEKEIIQSYIGELRGLEVYQVGEINQVLDKMEKELSNSKWKNDLELAVQQADDQMFKELLSIID